jgi:hypothetical protein
MAFLLLGAFGSGTLNIEEAQIKHVEFLLYTIIESAT